MKNLRNGINPPVGSMISAAIALFICACAAPEETTAEPALEEQLLSLDLTNNEDNARAFLLTRGSLNPEEEVIFYWKGEILQIEQPDPNSLGKNDFRSPILKFDGFNVARFEPTPDGTRMISREITVYRNAFGKIIHCWISGETPTPVRIEHVANDPVNFTIGSADYDIIGDQVVFKANISMDYPSPLPMNDYPKYSTGNTYQSTELFNFYVSEIDLRDPEAQTVPVEISWTRVGQPLPWMQIDPARGVQLVYHARGRKVLEGWRGLPEDLRTFVQENHPKFAVAPDTDESPNETSWRRFKKLIDAGEYSPTCP